jgi:ribose transport system substrate-binding protein
MKTIAVFTKNRLNPAYSAARTAADRVAASGGAKAMHYVPEKPDNVEQQKVLVEEAIKAKPDAVVFVPVHDEKMVPDAAKFRAAGIPVITAINRMAGDFVAHVGSDDVDVGYISAKALFQELGGKGKVIAIDGPLAAPTCRDRAQGVRKALAEFPGIELLGAADGANLRDEGRAATAGLLAKHPHVDGVWCANDVMAYGALEALDAAKRTAKVTGVNGLDEAIANVESGRMLATVDFSAFKIAHVAAEAAMRHLRGEPVPREVVVPAVLITRTNVATFKAPVTDRPVPAWKDVTS